VKKLSCFLLFPKQKNNAACYLSSPNLQSIVTYSSSKLSGTYENLLAFVCLREVQISTASFE
jgi:hypothetical protein